MGIFERAYAKINLSLDVLARMEDGYHSMEMVMQSVSLCDDIHIALNDSGNVLLRTNLSYLPSDNRNIAVKAAEAFFSASGIKNTGAEIRLVKRIPVCAGMGGGSSDGAAVLRGLNRHFGYVLSPKELESIGARLGSDVPFCIYGGTDFCTGRGEKLEALKPMPDCHILICKPRFAISTQELFSKIDCRKIKCRPATKGMLNAIETGSLSGIARRMYNVFEDVLGRSRESIDRIKSVMLDYGAMGAVMTGTGSAVFGIFVDGERAKVCKKELQADFPECFLAKPVKRLSESE